MGRSKPCKRESAANEHRTDKGKRNRPEGATPHLRRPHADCHHGEQVVRPEKRMRQAGRDAGSHSVEGMCRRGSRE